MKKSNKTFDVAKWSYGDIRMCAMKILKREITDKECAKVVDRLDASFDGSLGVTWDSIDLAIIMELKKD